MTPAAEISARFWRKMAKGGEIDRILNGHEPIIKRPPAPDEEIALIRRQIDTQMVEYEAAIRAAIAYWDGRKRANVGFRASRRQEARMTATADNAA